MDDRGASGECKPLICCSHNSHSLFVLLCRSSSRVDHGHVRLGYELSNGSTVLTIATVCAQRTEEAVRNF